LYTCTVGLFKGEKLLGKITTKRNERLRNAASFLLVLLCILYFLCFAFLFFSFCAFSHNLGPGVVQTGPVLAAWRLALESVTMSVFSRPY